MLYQYEAVAAADAVERFVAGLAVAIAVAVVVVVAFAVAFVSAPGAAVASPVVA